VTTVNATSAPDSLPSYLFSVRRGIGSPRPPKIPSALAYYEHPRPKQLAPLTPPPPPPFFSSFSRSSLRYFGPRKQILARPADPPPPVYRPLSCLPCVPVTHLSQQSPSLQTLPFSLPFVVFLPPPESIIRLSARFLLLFLIYTFSVQMEFPFIF